MSRIASDFCSKLPDSTFVTLALLQLPGVGCAKYWQLIQRFGCATALLHLNEYQLAQAFKGEVKNLWTSFCSNPLNSKLGEKLQRILSDLIDLNIELMACDDINYPELLKQISRPPALLYLRGNSSCLELPQIGIVGSRRPTPVGLNNANQFAHDLVQQGFAITSGLALGVDAAAHAGALRGDGKTLAVLGTGLDCIYPRQNKKLAEKILAEDGLLVSEFSLGYGARPGNFPQRNRIISGLSLGVLVVEAAAKSGSLITARLAAEQGREVFALPGSIHCPVSHGCNGLIRQGATLVESTEHMMEEIQGLLAFKSEQLSLLPSPLSDLTPENSISTEQQKLLHYLGYDVTSLDALAERSAINTGVLLAELMTLELIGVISQVAGGYLRVK
jgi:DNA processing protein